jgi:guanyl-specific ribonuclease Sa
MGLVFRKIDASQTLSGLLPALCVALIFTAAGVSAAHAGDVKADNGAICPPERPPAPQVMFQDVYRGMPFQPGERLRYKVRYMGVFAGFGELEVAAPAESQGNWYRAFRAQARTGDWYRGLYRGSGSVLAWSRPWDFGAFGYWYEQDGRPMLSKRWSKQKFLKFEQDACKVAEYTTRSGEPQQTEEIALSYGAKDILSAIYFLRTQDYVIGRTERTQVYLSGKNMWLQVEPAGIETVEVPAGAFQALKLKLQAYFEGEPVRKTRVDLWIAENHPQRPIVQVEAYLKVGHLNLELVEFKPGRDGPQSASMEPAAGDHFLSPGFQARSSRLASARHSRPNGK